MDVVDYFWEPFGRPAIYTALMRLLILISLLLLLKLRLPCSAAAGDERQKSTDMRNEGNVSKRDGPFVGCPLE